jgi:hypothetical protein
MIKPRSIGQLLKSTVRTAFVHKRVVLPIAIAFLLPFELVVLFIRAHMPKVPASVAHESVQQLMNGLLNSNQVPTSSETQSLSSFGAIEIPLEMFFFAVLFLLVIPIMYGSMTHFVSGLRLRDKKEDLGSTTAHAFSRLVPSALTNILLFGCYIALSLVLGIVAFIAYVFTSQSGMAISIVGGLLTLGVLLLSIWVLVRLSLLWAVVAEEKQFGFRAMGRSFYLTKGRFWKAFWFQLILFVVVFAVDTGIQYLWNVLFQSSPVSLILSIIVEILLLPFIVIGNAELYTDLRIRQDGILTKAHNQI